MLTIGLSCGLFYDNKQNPGPHGLLYWAYGGLPIALSSIYAIVTGIDYIKTLFDKRANLVISATGINDNLTIFSCGQIIWSDMTKIDMTKVFKANFLIIKLRDNSKYLQDKNVLQRFFLTRYIKKWGTPVVISEKRINYDLKDLKDLISKHLT